MIDTTTQHAQAATDSTLTPSQLSSLVQLWLDQARYAPSADNTQPWAATVSLSQGLIRIVLEIAPETLAHASEVDANFTTSYMALGALAKNLELLALADGYALSQVQSADLKFELSFKRSEIQSSPLRSWIVDRHTNRGEYNSEALSDSHRVLIENLQHQLKASHIGYTPRSQGKKLIQALGKLDTLRYTNKKLFFDFISKMRFGSEVYKSRDGLAGPTLGVPLMARLGLWMMKNLKFLWRLNFLGLQYASAWMGATRLLQKSAGMITLQAQRDTPLDWFHLGFDLQNVWMTLNSQGISVQPFGTPLLIYRAHLEESKALLSHTTLFAEEKRRSLLQLGKSLEISSGLNCSLPLIVLRVGYAKRAPQMKSLRRAVGVTQTLELPATITDNSDLMKGDVEVEQSPS